MFPALLHMPGMRSLIWVSAPQLSSHLLLQSLPAEGCSADNMELANALPNPLLLSSEAQEDLS